MYYLTDKEIDFLNRHGWRVEFVADNYYAISYDNDPDNMEYYLEGPLLEALHDEVRSIERIRTEWESLMYSCDEDQQILERVRSNQALCRLYIDARIEAARLLAKRGGI